MDGYIDEIQRRIVTLRAELRAKAPLVRATLPDAYRVNGDVYVESVGTIAHIANGTGEFFYTPDAATMRGPILQQLAVPRRELFRKLGRQLRSKSRILMVGAGSDVDSIEALLAEGHEVIATDFAENVVAALRRRANVPAFACDLLYLDQLLPEPVDYVFANSVLGYLDPGKANKVIANLWAAGVYGGVFTLDQTPHPHYFDIAERRDEDVLVNSTGADPRKLTSYVEKFGPQAGIAAMALHTHLRGRAINFAMMTVVAELFEACGGRIALGDYILHVPGNGNHPDPILRVAKGDDALLQPVEGEERFRDATEALQFDRDAEPQLQLLYVDRDAAEPLARALGIHTTPRKDAWEVIRYVAEHPPVRADLAAQREHVLTDINLSRAAERIRTIIKSGAFTPSKRLRRALMVDQTIHKGIVLGDMPGTPERADIEIDRVYAEERQRRNEKVTRTRAADADRARKEKQKLQRKDRKKQRR